MQSVGSSWNAPPPSYEIEEKVLPSGPQINSRFALQMGPAGQGTPLNLVKLEKWRQINYMMTGKPEA
jgi:hypothetical protein